MGLRRRLDRDARQTLGDPSRARPLGVGVVGLGRLWEARHKPALARLRDRLEVVAMHDPVARRAALEARQLGCYAATGLTELVAHPRVEAVYLLGTQWFGLHAAELACAHGKAIYCAVPPARHAAELEALAGRLRAARVPFVPELPRRFYPATLRLRELLATRLGAPRLVTGQTRLFGVDRYGDPGPAIQLTRTSLILDPGSNLLDWCRVIFQAEPESVRAEPARVLPRDEAPGSDFVGLTIRFPGGGLAALGISRYHQEAWHDASRFFPPPGFHVFAERGAARLEMPDRIQWADAEGTHDERLPMEPTVGELLGEHFRRAVRGEPSLAPTLDDALALARLVGGLESGEG
jgi:predicted dehydrogenase